MEIKYDMYKHYVKCYNEALGVASHKKRLYKNAKAKTHLYTYYGFIYLFSVLLVAFINFILARLVGYYWINLIISYFCLLMLVTILIYFILFGLRVHYSRCRLKKGVFCFDEKGIRNNSYMGIEMLFRWDKIKYIVVKKYSVIVLTDTPIFFFMNVEVKDELLSGINKYKNDITVIENKY